jgi:hypothetical protein
LFRFAQLIQNALARRTWSRQHVTLNVWTNYINLLAETDVDFSLVEPRKAA